MGLEAQFIGRADGSMIRADQVQLPQNTEQLVSYNGMVMTLSQFKVTKAKEDALIAEGEQSKAGVGIIDAGNVFLEEEKKLIQDAADELTEHVNAMKDAAPKVAKPAATVGDSDREKELLGLSFAELKEVYKITTWKGISPRYSADNETNKAYFITSIVKHESIWDNASD